MCATITKPIQTYHIFQMKINPSLYAFVAVLIQIHEHLVCDACPYLRTKDLFEEKDQFYHRRLQQKPPPPKPAPGTNIPTRQPTETPPSNSDPTLLPSQVPSVSSQDAPTAIPVPSVLGACQKPALAVKTSADTCAAFKSIKTAFDAATTNSAALSDIYGASVRLAFHDAGEADLTSPDSLGPDGCLSQSNSNAGLIEATSLVTTLLEPMWQKYCDKISRADFWVLFAKLSIEKADLTHTTSIAYHYGRLDNAQCEGGAGRLPSAGQGLSELNRVFVNQMGLTIQDSVALLGAHTLGHTHIANSGFGVVPPANVVNPDLANAWDGTPAVFDNQYYISLATKKWTNTLSTVAGQNQWAGPGRSIMLNADMALAFSVDTTNGQGVVGQSCVPGLGNQVYGCTSPTDSNVPSTAAQVQSYVNSNALFLSDFSAAFTKMVTVGCDDKCVNW